MNLEGISLFSGLSEAERSTVELFSQERLVRSGEVLFNEGDDATAMYAVKSGRMKVYRERSTGEQLLGYTSSGEVVGEMALFDPDAPKKRIASVQAIEDTQIIVIVDYAILELSKKHPEVFEKIQNIIRVRNEENKRRQGG